MSSHGEGKGRGLRRLSTIGFRTLFMGVGLAWMAVGVGKLLDPWAAAMRAAGYLEFEEARWVVLVVATTQVVLGVALIGVPRRWLLVVGSVEWTLLTLLGHVVVGGQSCGCGGVAEWPVIALWTLAAWHWGALAVSWWSTGASHLRASASPRLAVALGILGCGVLALVDVKPLSSDDVISRLKTQAAGSIVLFGDPECGTCLEFLSKDCESKSNLRPEDRAQGLWVVRYVPIQSWEALSHGCRVNYVRVPED